MARMMLTMPKSFKVQNAQLNTSCWLKEFLGAKQRNVIENLNISK